MVTNQTSLAVANDIRDIKPPIEIYGAWEWLWWVLVVMALVASLLAVLLVFLLRKKPKLVPPVPPAHIRARQKLEEALALIASPKPFVIAVSDAARAYLEERFDFRAPERTTEEFLHELSDTDLLLPDQKESLGRFLESCDLVKFAKYEPREPELRELHSSALRLVEETKPVATEKQIATSPQNAGETIQLANQQPSSDSKGKAFAIVGALFQLAPLAASIAGIVYGYRTYHAFFIDLASNSATDNSQLAVQLEDILKGWLWWLVICLLVWLAGLVLLVIALVRLRYRARWFFWFLIVYGIMMLPAFPHGTLFGAIVLIYCLTRRREFPNWQSPGSNSQ